MLAEMSTPAQASSGWSFGRILAVVLASLIGLVALALVASGGLLLWVDKTKRDADGYLTTPKERLSTSAYALTSESLDVGVEGPDWLFREGRLGKIRISAARPDGSPVFIGIAPDSAVQGYLAGVAHEEIADIDVDPFGVRYEGKAGGPPRNLPGEEVFWAEKASGPGQQLVTWEVAQGRWAVVVMNADAAQAVTVDVRLGAEASFIDELAWGLLGGGMLVGLLCAVIAVAAFRRRAAASVAAPVAAGEPLPGLEADSYPVRVTGDLDPSLSRWLWLVKWLLAIPHYIVLAFLWIAFVVLTVVAFFAILFTAQYPRGIFDFNVGVMRWTYRVAFYATNVLGTDRYPPFSLSEDPEYPARLEIPYPERLSRGLVLVKWWLLAIPHYVVLGIFFGGWSWGWHAGGFWSPGGWGGGWQDDRFWSPGLNGVLVLFAAVTLLFTAHFPRSLFDLALGTVRWAIRVGAYAALMRDEYPPFRLDR